MEEHKLWIKKGIEDNIFLLVGSIKPNLGGLIIVHNISLQELEEKIHKDPFIEHDIVKAEILEIELSIAHKNLAFLLN